MSNPPCRAPCTSLLELGRVAILHSKALASPHVRERGTSQLRTGRALRAPTVLQFDYSPSCCLIASSTWFLMASRLKKPVLHRRNSMAIGAS